MRGNHRWLVHSPHKGTVTRKMFPFDEVMWVITSYLILSYHTPGFLISKCNELTREHLASYHQILGHHHLPVGYHETSLSKWHMVTSSNRNIFRVTGHLSGQRPVTRSFDVFFDLRLNKRLGKQSWGWWFETLSCPLWRHRNEVNLTRADHEV